MNEDRDKEDEPFVDLWTSNWEQQCVQHLESEPDYEGQLQSERDLANQKVWFSFENTATSIAQLYKGDKFRYANLLCSKLIPKMSAHFHFVL